MATPQFTDIDHYISTLPESTQEIVQKLRELINRLIPNATEAITYNMPTFKLGEHSVVYFAAWKNHIGFYALEPRDTQLHAEVKPYLAEKGTVQIPFVEPFPFDLIEQLIEDKLKYVDELTY